MSVRLHKAPICPVVIGRSDELAILATLMDNAAQGRAHTAFIRGEAGIGKSRLLAQAIAAARDHGFAILQAECFETDGSSSYTLLLDLLQAFLAAHHPGLPAPGYTQLLHELVRLLPDLALVLPAHDTDAPPEPLDPERNRRRLFSLFTRLLHEYATRQPILLVVDDAHWCDESSLAALLHLVRHSADLPFAFLFSYRSEDASPAVRDWIVQLCRERRAIELELIPLASQEVAAMVQAIVAAEEPAPAALLDMICTLTEGNPFFIEEVLQSLLASGKLRYHDTGWEWPFAIGDPIIPTIVPRTIQGIVRQRVSRLSAPAHQALLSAAIVGRRFDFLILQHILHIDEAELLLLVKELIAAQFIGEESADQFVFRHALIHQAVAGMLLTRERQALHRAVAEVIEALSAKPGWPAARLADLAHHFYAAGAWAPALEYQQRAGERALAHYAPGVAIDHMTYALDAAGHMDSTPLGALYLARGQAHAMRGNFDQAHADYAAAREAAHAASDGATEWQSMVALGSLWASRDYAQTGAWFQRASELAMRLADPILHAHSLNHTGNWRANIGRAEEGLHAHGEALTIFQEQDHWIGMAESHDLLGTAYGMLGDRIQAVEHLGHAIILFRSLNNTPRLITSLAMRALQSMPGACETTLSPLRTRDACVWDAEEALRQACRIDTPADQVFAENALAHTLLAFGDLGQALAHAWAAERAAAVIAHQQWQVAIAYCLGQAYVLLQIPNQALSALEAGLSLAERLRSMFWNANLVASVARAYVLSHNPIAARNALEAVMPLEQYPRNIAERTIALAWGELLLTQRDPERALQIAEHLLASVPNLASVRPTQPVPHLLKLKGEALLMLAQPNAAAATLVEARQGALERNARPLLWTIHRALGNTFQKLGNHEQADQELAAARRVIAELAATIDELALRNQFEHAALATLPSEQPVHQREAAKRTAGGLTAREREVATLIARGKTSREIAELLVVSERTAEVHVSNILGKLGFHSRTQIAVWAVETGLTQS